MTEEAVTAAVGHHMPLLSDMLGLQRWRIEVRFDRMDDAGGRCRIHAPYQYAIIWLDPENIDDEKELVIILRHELVHVLLWPIHAFGNMIETSMPGGELPAMGHHAWTFYVERAVTEIEALLDRHDITAHNITAHNA